MAEAFLRVAGGFTVTLRMPAAAVPDDDAEQLGQATPQFQDVPLGPAVWRRVRTGAEAELVVSAGAVEAIVGSLAYDSAAVLFRAAAGISINGDLLEVSALTPVTARGKVAVYRVSLREAAALEA